MKKKFLTLTFLVLALCSLAFTTISPCTDECLADLQAQRNFCATLPTPGEAIACRQAAQQAYNACVANCQ